MLLGAIHTLPGLISFCHHAYRSFHVLTWICTLYDNCTLALMLNYVVLYFKEGIIVDNADKSVVCEKLCEIVVLEVHEGNWDILALHTFSRINK